MKRCKISRKWYDNHNWHSPQKKTKLCHFLSQIFCHLIGIPRLSFLHQMTVSKWYLWHAYHHAIRYIFYPWFLSQFHTLVFIMPLHSLNRISYKIYNI